MWRSGILFLAATCYSIRTAMAFGFIANRKMLRVLKATNDGAYTENEIAERANLSVEKVKAPLHVLEQRGYLSSGRLMPAELKIYRVTLRGQDALAKRVIS